MKKFFGGKKSAGKSFLKKSLSPHPFSKNFYSQTLLCDRHRKGAFDSLKLFFVRGCKAPSSWAFQLRYRSLGCIAPSSWAFQLRYRSLKAFFLHSTRFSGGSVSLRSLAAGGASGGLIKIRLIRLIRLMGLIK